MKERHLSVLVHGIGYTVCCRSRERISKSLNWGRRSCKQLSDTVTERKNLLPIQTSEHRGIVLQHIHTPNHTAYGIQFSG